MFLGSKGEVNPKTTTDCSSRVCTNSLMNSDLTQRNTRMFSGVRRSWNSFQEFLDTQTIFQAILLMRTSWLTTPDL